jgi:transglutaminase-like putative cysteine protease
MLLEIVHETRYDYAAPVSLAHHLAHLQPMEDAHQQLLDFDLDIEPAPAQRRDSRDAMGNAQRHFSLVLPHDRLRVRAGSRVRVQPRFGDLQAAQSPAWDVVAERLRYVARAPFRPEVEFAMPSPYVPRLETLRDLAAPSLPPGRPLAEAALELMHRIHTDFAYDSESTEIDTPLAQVLEHRRGVCQDFAHLMTGALRMWGLPARYVSGYLLTHAPEGGAAMLGADASHAWVQVWCPGTPGVPAEGSAAGWLDLDPTNDVVPGSGHVRLAVGRDYADVTPLRGVIRGGGGSHTLSVAVRTRVAKAAAEAAAEAGPRVASVNPQES